MNAREPRNFIIAAHESWPVVRVIDVFMPSPVAVVVVERPPADPVDVDGACVAPVVKIEKA